MIRGADGVELILGIKKDPVFGTVVMVGMGGTTAELFADRSLGFPPLNERLARRMLESLKIWPLLNGYRGRRPARIDQLMEVLIRLSYFAADYPEIVELDINPLLVTPERVIALDARMVVDGTLDLQAGRPYAHLALRPYPEEIRALGAPDRRHACGSGPSGPRTSRCGWSCWPAARANRFMPASAIFSNGSRTRRRSATASSTTTARSPSSRSWSGTASASCWAWDGSSPIPITRAWNMPCWWGTSGRTRGWGASSPNTAWRSPATGA